MTPESMSTDVIVEYDRWNEIEFSDIAETATKAVFKYLDLGPSRYSVAILACDDSKISSLNNRFRGKANPTNVLSWPAFELAAGEYPDAMWDDEPIELGDVAIAFETCRREAQEQGKQMEHHVTHLLIHGVLHLFGYDHEEDIEAELMEAKETAILATLGIADPYILKD